MYAYVVKCEEAAGPTYVVMCSDFVPVARIDYIVKSFMEEAVEYWNGSPCALTQEIKDLILDCNEDKALQLYLIQCLGKNANHLKIWAHPVKFFTTCYEDSQYVIDSDIREFEHRNRTHSLYRKWISVNHVPVHTRLSRNLLRMRRRMWR